MFQALTAGDVELLNFMIKRGEAPPLDEPDAMGTYPIYLAILNDRPEMVRFLHSRGVDLSATCDDQGFGTCAFYAVQYGRYHLIEVMDELGVDFKGPCNKINETPLFIAKRSNNKTLYSLLHYIVHREDNASLRITTLLRAVAARNIVQRRWKAMRVMQQVARAWFANRRVAEARRLKAIADLAAQQKAEAEAAEQAAAEALAAAEAEAAAAAAGTETPQSGAAAGAETTQPAAAATTEGTTPAEAATGAGTTQAAATAAPEKAQPAAAAATKGTMETTAEADATPPANNGDATPPSTEGNEAQLEDVATG